MLNSLSMLWHATIIFHYVHVYTCLYRVHTSTFQYILSAYQYILVLGMYWQALSGWPDCREEYREAGCCHQGVRQASEGDSWGLQGWSCLIGNEVWVWLVWVYTGKTLVHVVMYWYKQRIPENMGADIYFTLNCEVTGCVGRVYGGTQALVK